MKPYIIAEIGSNWVKSENKAYNLKIARNQIELASMTKASAVKFQLYTAQELYGPRVKGTPYEKKFNQTALPREYVPILYETAKANGLDFMCSAFSVDGFQFVDPYVKVHKLASCELFDKTIVGYLFNEQSKPVYYSDGCGLPDFILPQRDQDIRMACVTSYPSRYYDYDIDSYKHPFGLSDHTLGLDLALRAYDKGCRVFEKHVDFLPEIKVQTPDTCVSIDLHGFIKYVMALENFSNGDSRIDKNALKAQYARLKTNHGYFRPIPNNK